jgi:soluble lytic murein transglycosylase
LIDWFVARQPDSNLSAAEIVAVMEKSAGWPEPERLQLRAEQAFHALGPEGKAVLAFYSKTEPLTIGGKLALAGALREAGRADEAVAIVRDLWREESLSSGQAAAVLARFGSELSRADHIYRFRRLVLNRESADARTQAQVIGPGYDQLARAVIAVLDRSSKGPALLDGVARRFSADPLYVLAKARLLRRKDKPVEAAGLILKSTADATLPGDADVWWDERRDLSRKLLDHGKPDLAYKIAAGHHAAGEAERTEAAFHTGWYALRFLDDPKRAEPHFRTLRALATLARTRSRAAYWLGRTFEAQGKKEAARAAYERAAHFGGTFYGQAAREKLGIDTTGFERAPAPSARDRLRFAGRTGVRVIRLLVASGHGELAHPFIRTLAETVETEGEAALLTALARRIGQPRAGTQAALIAERRGLAVASLPAPFIGVPPDLPLPDAVDRALVYAVVRQESAFNYQATSHAGARGLMQLMPATAKATARNAGLPFSVQRLTTDPHYNATLGAFHLGELLDRLNRSYILTFVAYNAGPGRARDWVKAYGDPRGGAVDPIDWIERIPFDETRDYVQKVMENLQVYRSRIGHPLSLTEDLVRGGPQG